MFINNGSRTEEIENKYSCFTLRAAISRNVEAY